MTTQDYMFAQPARYDILNGNTGKTLPDVDLKGGIYLPRFVDVTRLVDSNAQVYAFLKSDILQQKAEWRFASEQYDVRKQFFSTTLQHMANSLPPNWSSDLHNVQRIWLEKDPLSSYSETPVPDDNFDGAPLLTSDAWTAYRFGLGSYTDDTARGLWDYTGEKGFLMKPWLLPDDVRKLYSDVKKFDTDIFTLNRAGNLWGRYSAIGALSHLHPQEAASNDCYAITQNGGGQQRELDRECYGWYNNGRIATFNFYQRYARSNTTTYPDGSMDPYGFSHYKYDCIDQWSALETPGGDWSYCQPVKSQYYAPLIKRRQMLLVFKAEREYYSDTSQYKTSNVYVARMEMRRGAVENFTDAYGDDYGLCRKWNVAESDVLALFETIAGIENFTLLKDRDFTNETHASGTGPLLEEDELQVRLLGCYHGGMFHGSFGMGEWQYQV